MNWERKFIEFSIDELPNYEWEESLIGKNLRIDIRKCRSEGIERNRGRLYQMHCTEYYWYLQDELERPEEVVRYRAPFVYFASDYLDSLLDMAEQIKEKVEDLER